MNKYVPQFFFALTSSILLSGCEMKRPAPSIDDEKMAIEQIIEQYIASINTCDTSIVNKIWSHQHPATFIAPSGFYPSFEAIRDSLVLGIFDARFTCRNLQKEDLRIFVDGNSAWSQFSWSFDAVTREGERHQTHGLETQIFSKESDGSWRLVHIHYSGR